MYVSNSNEGILRICGDEEEKPTAKQKERAKLLLMKLALEKSPRIRDEIILQLVKQIRGNPNKISSDVAWGTLACILSMSNPSEGFTYPLMHWLIDVIEIHESPSFKEWGRYILARIYNNHNSIDKRVFVPEVNEITYIYNKKMIKIAVFMPNGTFMTCYIESYTNFDALKDQVLKRLGLHTEHTWRYGIMETVEFENKFGKGFLTVEERFLEGHFNVLDTVSSWGPLKQKDSQVLKCKLHFIITANMVYLEGSEFISKLQCLQYAVSVYRGKVVMSNTELSKLAAILYSADHKTPEEAEENLE
jgi:hypothetical protein